MPGIQTTTWETGAQLIRHYYSTPDELGTATYWRDAVNNLGNQMPFGDYWRNLRLHIWHMDHPDLRLASAPPLLDADPATPGYQCLSGVHTDPGVIHLPVFPNGFDPARPTGKPLTETNRLATRQVFSHEAGHMYSHFVGYARSGKTVWAEITRHFDSKRPYKGHNKYEDWAECYRYFHGADDVRGTFSDGTRFNPSAELVTLFKAAYWLSVVCASSIVQNMSISPGWVQWYQPAGFLSPAQFRALAIDQGEYHEYVHRNNRWERC